MLRNFLILAFFFALPALCEETTGTICLGSNLAKPFDEQTNRVYLRINNSEKIFFIRPYSGPRVIASHLDLTHDHSVKVYFDDQVVQSWTVNFEKLNSAGINIWRAPGSWRSESINPNECK